MKNDLDFRNQEDEKQKILQWLSDVQSLERQDTIVKDTFRVNEWLLDSSEFKAWMKNPSWWLWCYGEPGVGKTVLASQVAQHLRDKTKRRETLVLALFFEIKNPALQNMESVLGSLVKQCIQNSAGGVRSPKLKRMYSDSRSERKPQEQDLLKVLEEEFHRAALVYLIIDNWDGISQDFRSTFEDVIRELKVRTLVFARSSESDLTPRIIWCHKCGAPNLKIYYYCCCEHCLDMDFCEDCYSRSESCGQQGHKMITPDRVHVLVRPEDEQIRRYIEWEMSRAVTGSSKRRINPRSEAKSLSRTSLDRMLGEKPALRTQIPEIIAIKSNSNFQLAKLHIAAIKGMPTVKDIEDSLAKEAQGLSRIYRERIEQLSELDPKEKAEALMTSLYWIANCRRPLSFPALQHAVAVTPHTSEIDRRNMLHEEGLILDSSGIVIINSESKVRIDMTMQEWLEKNPGDWFDGQEIQMALKLLTYLNYDEFRHPCPSDDEAALEERLRWMPLLEYASQYWAEHVAPCCTDESVKAELLKFLTRKGSIDSCLQAAYKTSSKLFADLDIRKGANGLHLAAFNGLEEVVVDLIKDESIDVNDVDEKYGQTALMYAARNGHVAIVDTLLNNGAKIDMWSSRGGHALFDAYPGDQKDGSTNSEIAKLILRSPDSKVNLRYPRQNNRTLLMLASYLGDQGMVCYILSRHRDVNVNAQDDRGYTALMLAIERIQSAVVESLLKDSRVKVNLRQETGESAIELAANTQDSTLMEMMFANRSSFLQSWDESHLAFFKAVEQGDANMVRTLREQKVPVNGLDQRRRTLLHTAASQRNENVVQLLIDFGLNKNAQADDGATPLHEASRQGNLEVVKTLLRANADRTVKDKFGRTPLVVARQNAKMMPHYRIMNELDSTAIDIKRPLEQIVSNVASLPTWSLVQIGLFDHIQQRLTKRSGWDLMDRCPDTGNCSLHFAAILPRKKTLELLLQEKLDQNIPNLKKQTPLHIAVDRDDLLTVELLLRYPPCPLNAQDHYGRRPLRLAHEKQNFAIAVVLVEAGSALDPQDRTYLDPTFLEAVKLGKAGVAEELIQAGADHLRPGTDGITAKQIAISLEDFDMLRVLDRNKSVFIPLKPTRTSTLSTESSNGSSGDKDEDEVWSTPPGSPMKSHFRGPDFSEPAYVARPH